MATANRTALITRIQKVLKKNYSPIKTSERPILEHLLFACCYENTHYADAEEAMQTLTGAFFDFNEVRVSTVKELAEVLHKVASPIDTAAHLKRVLQAVFETTYSFDLEDLKKKNLGQAVAWLKALDGATPFIVAYMTQIALGGHAIPLDRGTLGALQVVGAVTEPEIAASTMTGLERAIAKAKGPEFASLLHQLGADFAANPYSPALHKILLEIDPGAKPRLPSRRSKSKASSRTSPEPAAKSKSVARSAKPTRKTAKPPSSKKSSTSKKKTSAKKKPTTKTPKKPTTKGSKAKSARGKKKKPATSSITRRKPR